MDDILEAQKLLEERTAPTPPQRSVIPSNWFNKKPETEPNNTGGGVPFSKALPLETPMSSFFVLILIIAVSLALALGFLIGMVVQARSQVKATFDPMLYENRVEQTEYIPPTPVSTPQPLEPVEKRIPRSSVMKYKPVAETRKQKEQEELDRELIKIATREYHETLHFPV